MIRSLVRPAAGVCAASALTAVLLAVPASTPSEAASIVLNNCNSPSISGPDGSGNFTLSCGAGGGGGSISCSIGASPSAPTVSQNVTLTANCSGATGTITYSWSGGGSGGCPAASSNTNQAALTAPGVAVSNCNYSVQANDSGTNTSSSPAKAISWTSGGGGGGGGGGGAIDCAMPNGGRTIVINASFASASYFTANFGSMGPNDAVVLKFTTPASDASTRKGSIAGAEYNSVPSQRYGALSASPCDFAGSFAPLGIFGGGSTNATASFAFVQKSGVPLLNTGTTYYFNIANAPGANCNSTGNCDMIINFAIPN